MYEAAPCTAPPSFKIMNIFIKKIIVVVLPLIGLAFANLTVKLKLPHFCLIKLIFHHECWGCGLTRALVALGKLDFQTAYEYNHLVFIVAALLFLAWIQMLVKIFQK